MNFYTISCNFGYVITTHVNAFQCSFTRLQKPHSFCSKMHIFWNMMWRRFCTSNDCYPCNVIITVLHQCCIFIWIKRCVLFLEKICGIGNLFLQTKNVNKIKPFNFWYTQYKNVVKMHLLRQTKQSQFHFLLIQWLKIDTEISSVARELSSTF